jgi:hypothetical protein
MRVVYHIASAVGRQLLRLMVDSLFVPAATLSSLPMVSTASLYSNHVSTSPFSLTSILRYNIALFTAKMKSSTALLTRWRAATWLIGAAH